MQKPDLNGEIKFLNVQFSYPSRPGVEILKNLSFHVSPGQTIALVGSSGSGKSTCVQLLQRFYDPDAGKIYLDGHPIDQYNLHWLREHLGVVSQEPILFQTTIRENILFGLHSASDDDVMAAAKMANAHDFIMNLPEVSREKKRKMDRFHDEFRRNTKLKWVNVVQHFQVDKNNVLVGESSR